jgi:acetyl esterase/lipase
MAPIRIPILVVTCIIACSPAGGVWAGDAAPDESAKKVARQFLDALAAKDVEATIGLCDLPWLGPLGTADKLIPDRERLRSELRTMINQLDERARKRPRNLGEPLLWTDFREEYRDQLRVVQGAKILEGMKLTGADRLFVEKQNGWLIVVRSGEKPQVAAFLLGGFQKLPGTQLRDVVYGRRYGVALTLDVLKPPGQANGAAIIDLASGDFISAPPVLRPHGRYDEMLRRGYTVFVVTHGSVPKYTIAETVADVHRAVRFVRRNAPRYGIDPERIGVTGSSSGGHLSLMLGVTAGKGFGFYPPSDQTAPTTPDPVEAESSRVQAVACFFPPTDWLNYGAEAKSVLEHPMAKLYRSVFAFQEWDPRNNAFAAVTDEKTIRKILADLSPINRVTAETPPTLILHGDADRMVPIEQSERFIAKLKAVGGTGELIARKGAGHGWNGIDEDERLVLDWFDKHLKPAK